MIHRAKFQNFKALRDVEITFDSRLTVLVGPNGSGKTSVLRGLEVLCRVLSRAVPPNQIFIPPLSLSDVFGGSATESLVLQALETIGVDDVNGVEIEANTAPRIWPGSKRAAVCHWRVYSVRAGVRKNYPPATACPEDVQPSFAQALLLQLSPTQLAQPSVTQAVPPQLQASGLGLPSVLAYLKLYDEEQFDAVIAQFRQLIPNVKRVRIDRVRAGGDILGEGLLFDLPSQAGVRATAMSDGTLYLLGLITAICGPHRPKVLLLDDLDHGLHPKAQMELIGVLRALLARFPDLQIIATSHSPFILNQLEWNEVRVTGLRDDGSAICARLEDHPEVERWREAMTPGEFWSHIGDEWVKKLDKPKAEELQPEPVAS